MPDGKELITAWRIHSACNRQFVNRHDGCFYRTHIPHAVKRDCTPFVYQYNSHAFTSLCHLYLPLHYIGSMFVDDPSNSVRITYLPSMLFALSCISDTLNKCTHDSRVYKLLSIWLWDLSLLSGAVQERNEKKMVVSWAVNSFWCWHYWQQFILPFLQVVDSMMKKRQTPQVVLRLMSTSWVIQWFQVKGYDYFTQSAFIECQVSQASTLTWDDPCNQQSFKVFL